jgi:hypothetical protein
MLPPCCTRRTSSGEPSLRSSTQARKLFEDFCETIPKLFIVIDGLDECERVERSQILDILTEIVGQCDTKDPGKLRLLLVSQDYADIRKGLQGSAISRMAPRIFQISDADNDGDIQAYTRMWVDRIASKFSPFTDDMNRYLRSLTVVNAKGTVGSIRSIALSSLTSGKECFFMPNWFSSTLMRRPHEGKLIDAMKETNFPIGLEGA